MIATKGCEPSATCTGSLALVSFACFSPAVLSTYQRLGVPV
jgi:hypothetical protein